MTLAHGHNSNSFDKRFLSPQEVTSQSPLVALNMKQITDFFSSNVPF